MIQSLRCLTFIDVKWSCSYKRMYLMCFPSFKTRTYMRLLHLGFTLQWLLSLSNSFCKAWRSLESADCQIVRSLPETDHPLSGVKGLQEIQMCGIIIQWKIRKVKVYLQGLKNLSHLIASQCQYLSRMAFQN